MNGIAASQETAPDRAFVGALVRTALVALTGTLRVSPRRLGTAIRGIITTCAATLQATLSAWLFGFASLLRCALVIATRRARTFLALVYREAQSVLPFLIAGALLSAVVAPRPAWAQQGRVLAMTPNGVLVDVAQLGAMQPGVKVAFVRVERDRREVGRGLVKKLSGGRALVVLSPGSGARRGDLVITCPMPGADPYASLRSSLRRFSGVRPEVAGPLRPAIRGVQGALGARDVAVRRGACDLLPYDEQIRGLFAQLLKASAAAAPASQAALAPQGPRISKNASAFIYQPSAPSAGADSQPANHGLRPLPPPQGPGQGPGSSSQGSYPQPAEQQGSSQIPDPQAQPGWTNNGQYNAEVFQQYRYGAAADNTFPGNAQQLDNSQSAFPQPLDYPSQSPSYPQQQPAYPSQAPQPTYVPQPPAAAPLQESSFQRVLGAIAQIAEAIKTIPSEDRPHPRVRGIVRNAAGVPVSGASVIAVEWNQSTRTGSDGTFSLEGGPAGRVTVRITATGYQDTEQLAQAATGAGERQEYNIRNQ